METLTAFVRERARWKDPNEDGSESVFRLDESPAPAVASRIPTDIAAVLSVICRTVAAKALRRASNAHLHGPQVNLDGVMCQTHREDPQGDYVQLYRNGAVELAYAHLLFRSPLDNRTGESLRPDLYEIPFVRQGCRRSLKRLPRSGWHRQPTRW